MGASQQFDLLIKAKTDTDTAFVQVKSRLQEISDKANTLNQQNVKLTSTAGSFAGAMGRVSTTLARSATVFGLNADALRAVDDAADVAELGFNNLTKSAVGLNAATVAVTGAGLALGYQIGTLAREYFPELAKKADEAAVSLMRFFGVEAGSEEGNRRANAILKERIDLMNKQAAAAGRRPEATNEQIAALVKAKEQTELLAKAREILGRDARNVQEAERVLAEAHKASAAGQREAGQAAKERAAEEERAATEVERAWEKAFKTRLDARKRAADMEQRIVDSVAAREEEVAQRAAERVAQSYADMVDAQIQDAERLGAEQEKRAREAEEEAWRLQDAYAELAGSLLNAGDSIGGFLGGILSLGGAGIQVFQNLKHQAKETSEKVAAAAAAINAAVGAFQSGSAFQGALGGAAAGSARGPWGAVIGFIGGGLLGLFGKAKQNAEAVRQLQQQLLETYGGMEALQKKAQELGVDLSVAFSTKDPKLLAGIINQLNKAIEDQKKRWEGLQTAISGLDKMTQAWASGLEEATVKNGAAFQRLGTYALAIFAGIVKETGNAIAALDQIGPSLDRLIEAQKKFGLEGSAALQQLLAYRQFFVQNKAIADSLSGLTDIMAGLDAAGIHSQELFNSFGKDLVSIFNQMQAKGLGATQALAFMQPQLQQLWEAQRDFGLQTDAATQALLNQAEQQGLVGENMRSVNDKILSVLVAIADVLGATLPESLRRMADSAEREFGRFSDAARNAGGAIPNVPGGGEGNNPRGGPGGREGHAYGNAYIPAQPPYGRAVRVGEREGEHILTNPQLENAIARGVAKAGGGSGGGGAQAVTVNLTLDGRVLARVIAQQTKDGRFRVHPASVKGF
jgi:hypothetical protein